MERRYRHRPSYVMAAQYLGGFAGVTPLTLVAWVKAHNGEARVAGSKLLVLTREGVWMQVEPGSWVIRRDNDSFDVYTAEDFEATYDDG